MSGLIKRHPKYSVLAPVGKTVRIQSSTAEKQASAKKLHPKIHAHLTNYVHRTNCVRLNIRRKVVM